MHAQKHEMEQEAFFSYNRSFDVKCTSHNVNDKTQNTICRFPVEYYSSNFLFSIDYPTKAGTRRVPHIRRLIDRHFLHPVPPTTANKMPQRRSVVCSNTKLNIKKRRDSYYMCIYVLRCELMFTIMF
ncbi:hypothetical protein ABEB36_014412 [Hypothenemus hampei]|uniref:Uncharacterized protein n=1 Tax=Hypothenemus hampei TaxID=57062 RepID=A0ABD1E207_HYPHA